MTRVICIAIAAALLAGCTNLNRDRELPSNSGAGADEMKLSPCACMPLDYEGRGYEWVG